MTFEVRLTFDCFVTPAEGEVPNCCYFSIPLLAREGRIVLYYCFL
jgi:hypothetical protein